MEDITPGMVVAIGEARSACRGEPDIIERLRKAMKMCHDHWMETNKDNQFRAATAAAYLESSPEEQQRIQRSSIALGRLSATITALERGVLVDLKAMAEQQTDPDILPLAGLWHETE